MKDMVQNGSNQGAGSLPPDEIHPEFLELCALATSGSLSAEEGKRLAEHLSGCAACRKAMAQYEAVVGKILPVLGAEPPDTDRNDNSSWSLEDAEASLFARLNQEDDRSAGIEKRRQESTASSYREPIGDDALWRHMWWQYAAGLVLLAALGFAVYRVGIQQGRQLTGHNFPVTPAVSATSRQDAKNQTAAPPPMPSTAKSEKEMAELHAELEKQAVEIAHLKANQGEIENDRNAKAADADRLSRESLDLTQQLTTAQANLRDLQQKLDASTSQRLDKAAELASLHDKIAQLNGALQDRDQEVAREQNLLDHDRDIRDLMGARDLYIAEVYDVAKSGDTEKPFGRVFYTKGKSLIFYAYDLDQQPGLKNASTFQAWGRRGPDTGHAVNLGILFQDNASKKRWVLKSHDPKMLEQIDAVFVTVEPNGGSSHPSGKPFLFAYLRNDPNHP